MALNLAAVINTSAVLDGLTQMAAKTKPAIARSLTRQAETILTRSREAFVPVDEDILRTDSGVDAPVIAPDRISVRLGFGAGPASAYAMAVHEHLSKHSPRSWKVAEREGRPVQFRVGGPKYLERPFVEATSGGKFLQETADDVAAELAR